MFLPVAYMRVHFEGGDDFKHFAQPLTHTYLDIMNFILYLCAYIKYKVQLYDEIKITYLQNKIYISFFMVENLFIISSPDISTVWCMFNKAKPVERSCPIFDLNHVFSLAKKVSKVKN